MNLRYFEGKNVRLIDNEGKIFEGYAADYIFPEDNVPEEIEALVLDYPVRISDGYKYKNPVEFKVTEITNIEIL